MLKVSQAVYWTIIMLALFFVFFVTAPQVVYSAVGINPQIPFYGTLRDAGGSAVSGSYDIVFNIYDAPTGGNILWTGVYTIDNGNPVTISSGNFKVMLGSGAGNALSLDFNDDTYYLGVTVGDDAEMTPRDRLGASGYAINAHTAISAQNADLLSGLTADVFLRSGQLLSLSTSTWSTLLSIEQTGGGNLMSVRNENEEVFTILNNGNIGIGDTEPEARLSVFGNAYFSDSIQVADGSGIILGGEDDGLFLYQDTFGYGAGNLVVNLRGSALSENIFTITSPGAFSLVANGDSPAITLGDDGGIDFSNTTFGDPESRTLSITMTNGVRINEGDLILENGNIGIGVGIADARLDVAGGIQSSDLFGGGSLSADANGNIILDPSDRNLKKNIRTIENGLETLLNLRGVRYEWKDMERFGPQTEIGFLAQELQTTLPEVVRDSGEYLSVNTKNISAVIVEAFKEFYAKADEYFNRTEALEREVELLRREVEILKGASRDEEEVEPVSLTPDSGSAVEESEPVPSSALDSIYESNDTPTIDSAPIPDESTL